MFSLTSRPASGSLSTSRDPFALMDSLFTDWLASRPNSSLVAHARIDVTERDANYEVRAELPGARREDISVELEGNRVAISAKTDAGSEKVDADKLLYSERTSESYARTFELPHAVDPATTVAKFENGLLTLTLPKRDMPQPRRIEVQ